MEKVWASMVAGAAALSIGGVGQTAHADADSELIARDRNGDIRVMDDAAGFGEEGQIAVSTDAQIGFDRRSQDDGPTFSHISLLPAADYFVMENLSVGGIVGIDWEKGGDTKSLTFLLGPRVGYNFELSRLLSVWPKLGLSYAHTKTKFDGDDTRKNDAVRLNLFAPVMLHPAPHFFAGFGPFLDTDLNGGNRVTTWGFKLTVGGWV